MYWYTHPESMTAGAAEMWAMVAAQQCVEQMHTAGMRSVAFDRLGNITRPGVIEVIFTHESALHVSFPGKCGTDARSRARRSARSARTTSSPRNSKGTTGTRT